MVRVDLITTNLLRRVIAETESTSPNVKRNAITRLSTILTAATREGLLVKNPAELIDLPKRSKKEIDPFTFRSQHHHQQTVRAQTLAKPDLCRLVRVHVLHRAAVVGGTGGAVGCDQHGKKDGARPKGSRLGQGRGERAKTGIDRFVLLNDRALRAIQFARQYADHRRNGIGAVAVTPFVFPPSKNAEYDKQTSDLHKQWVPMLRELGFDVAPV